MNILFKNRQILISIFLMVIAFGSISGTPYYSSKAMPVNQLGQPCVTLERQEEKQNAYQKTFHLYFKNTCSKDFSIKGKDITIVGRPKNGTGLRSNGIRPNGTSELMCVYDGKEGSCGGIQAWWVE